MLAAISHRYTSSQKELLKRMKFRLRFSLIVVIVLSSLFYLICKSNMVVDYPADSSEIVSDESTIVLQAKKVIVAGTLLQEDQLARVYWPTNHIPENAVKDPGELDGMYARVDIPQGIPILSNDLTREKRTPAFPTPGMRAMTLVVQEGFVSKFRSFVDIYVVETLSPNLIIKSNDVYSVIKAETREIVLLKNFPVLIPSHGYKGSVTLEVEPEREEKVLAISKKYQGQLRARTVRQE